MSSSCVEYILYTVREFLGSDIEGICSFLLNNESCSMRQILKEFSHLKNDNVTQYLKILIDINFVRFNFTDNHLDSYEFDIGGFFAFKRSARYLSIIEKNYGEISRVICYSLFSLGNLSVTEIIKHSNRYSNIQGDLVQVIGLGINDLVRFHVLEGSPMFIFENQNVLNNMLVDVDEIIEHISNNNTNEIIRKRKSTTIDSEQKLWNKQYCVNRDILNQLCKNDIIAEDALCTLGEAAGLVMNTFLRNIHSANMDSYYEPMSLSLLLRKVKEVKPNFSEEQFEDCIYLLTNDSQVTYMEEVRNQNGILVGFNDNQVTRQITIKHLIESVKVIFGQTGLIVFNHLLRHPYVEEPSLSTSVMLSPDQLNVLLPQMINKGFVSRLEMSKTKQYFDEPIISLLFVDVTALVRIQQEICYQCLRNLSVRLTLEQRRETPLLTKVYNLTVNEGSSVNDDEILVVTESDRKTLSALRSGILKLEASESSVVTSLIMYESYIRNETNEDTIH